MRIAFFVNAIENETINYTTTALALAAINRGHEVVYLTPGDFILRPDNSLMIWSTMLEGTRPKKPETFLNALKSEQATRKVIDIAEIDILFLRNDPSEDVEERPWATHAGTIFGRLAVERGVIVVNDPDGLARAQNKLYFQSFPDEVRPTTLISKNIDEIRSFIDEHRDGVILKPLQGSGGRNVFKISSSDEANLNQIFEAVSGEGYLIAQNYLPEAKAGDIRLFLMNGKPLERDGVYAAFRRVPAQGEVRSNIHASGTATKADITPRHLAMAEMVRPRLIEDGMFLVGLDIVGDKILEINVFTPGGLPGMAEIYGVNFSETIIEALEKKVVMREAYARILSNRSLAIF